MRRPPLFDTFHDGMRGAGKYFRPFNRFEIRGFHQVNASAPPVQRNGHFLKREVKYAQRVVLSPTRMPFQDAQLGVPSNKFRGNPPRLCGHKTFLNTKVHWRTFD